MCIRDRLKTVRDGKKELVGVDKEKDILYSMEKSVDNEIHFQYKGNMCESKGKKDCSFYVAVVPASIEEGDSDKHKRTMFALTARAQNTIVPLKEGKVERVSLEKGQNSSYSFALDASDATVEKVIFSIASLSGDAELFVSRVHRYPDASNNEQYTYYDSDWLEFNTTMDVPWASGAPPTTTKDEKTKRVSVHGPYFVTVSSEYSSSYYTLSVQVVRKGGEKHENKTKSSQFELVDGVPTSRAIVFPGETAQFFFKVSVAESYQGPCCLLYTSPSPRDGLLSRMPSSA
eukprot:TRINITY_DN14304_c0_g1_i1.p1 TRINITY_DN14304_c0_g1~~TRINITY_DN14304_c0_g1_i1.p1  ORF type:complete len:307 (+),score=105.59 TRINITY_DN14304_c0_g1_i1:60-923(+)